MTYDELFEIAEMKSAKILAGETGLYRLIQWYNIVKPINMDTMSFENNLVFTTEFWYTGQDSTQKAELFYELLDWATRQGAAGIILDTLNESELPVKVQELAEKWRIPIIAVAHEVMWDKLTYQIMKRLFKNVNRCTHSGTSLHSLLCGEYTDFAVQQLSYYGYLQNDKNYLFAVQIDKLPEDSELVWKQKASEQMDTLLYHVLCILNKKGFHDVLFTKTHSKVFLVLRGDLVEDAKSLFGNLVSEVKEDRFFCYKKENGEELHFSIGVACCNKGAAKLFRVAQKAEDALNMIWRCKKRDLVRFYEDTGVYQLFFEYGDRNQLMCLYRDILGKILAYDEQNETDMLKTLEVYMDSGMNISYTAELLQTHRNTVKYRIKRIGEIGQIDFENVNQCFNLRLAFKIKKYLQI